MSNRTPQSVTVPVAAGISIFLLVLTVALVVVGAALFARGAGDLLYSVAGSLALAMAGVPAYFLLEIAYSLIFERFED